MRFKEYLLQESKKNTPEDKLKEKYKRWKELINMSPSEIESFLESPDGKVAGLSRSEASKKGISSGRDSARAIVRMLRKNFEEWTSKDFEWMNKQISFISRMKGSKGALKDSKGEPTRKLLALKLWGHNPLKK